MSKNQIWVNMSKNDQVNLISDTERSYACLQYKELYYKSKEKKIACCRKSGAHILQASLASDFSYQSPSSSSTTMHTEGFLSK